MTAVGQSSRTVSAKQPVAGKAWLSVKAPDGRQWRVRVELDRTVARGAEPRSLKVVGAADDALVVVDTYASKAGALNLCQAGEESFLRVIRTSKASATETFHEKLESCRDNIELASPGLQWNTPILEVDWLSAPGTAGQTGRQVLKVGKNAVVKVEHPA